MTVYLFVDVGPLGAVPEVGLHLAELGQVQGGDLLSLERKIEKCFKVDI